MKTYIASPKDIERKWYIIDAEDMVLGRVSTEIAKILRGKHKPTYTPFIDNGDYVIVINADKIRLTGNKLKQKNYIYHTGYPGGQRQIPYNELMEKKPTMAIELAVKGMLPHGKLGRQMYKKLRVYAGTEHGHEAQMPEVYEF